MSPRADLKSRIAQALTAHAVRVAAPDHAEWAKAMMHELEHLPPDASALSWALGCVFVSYRARLRALTRLPDLPPWALLMISLLCLTPACWNFIYIAAGTLHADPVFPGALGLIFGSATLIGPIGLAAVLWTLAAWAIYTLRLPAQYPLLTHAGGNGIPTILLNLVLLPALGVALLQGLDARRRAVSPARGVSAPQLRIQAGEGFPGIDPRARAGRVNRSSMLRLLKSAVLGLIKMVVLLIMLLMLTAVISRYAPAADQPTEINYSTFLDDVKANRVDSVVFQGDMLYGTLKDKEQFRSHKPGTDDSALIGTLKQAGVSIKSLPPKQPILARLLLLLAPLLLILLFVRRSADD